MSEPKIVIFVDGNNPLYLEDVKRKDGVLYSANVINGAWYLRISGNVMEACDAFNKRVVVTRTVVTEIEEVIVPDDMKFNRASYRDSYGQVIEWAETQRGSNSNKWVKFKQ